MPSHRRGVLNVVLLAAVAVGAATVLPACSSSSTSSSTSTSAAPAGPHLTTLTPTLFARAPKGATNPDDITILNGLLYVTYQNNAGKDGTPTGSMSTIVAFDQHSGAVVATYPVVGRCDGLTADPTNGRLLASVNEDNNSSLYVITPGTATPVHYTYSPDPAETGSDGTNGGTDSIAVGANGTIYVAHSNPDPTLPPPNDTAAVYTMTLSGSTAKLTPLFGINDTAPVIDPGTGGAASEPMGLTDPDSNRFVAALNGGTLIQDSQGDSKLILVTALGAAKPALAVLKLTNLTGDAKIAPQIDDMERIGGAGTIYAVDQLFGNVFAIPTTSADQGVFVVSQPKPSTGDLANNPALGVVDLTTGVVTPRSFLLGSPKGLLFVKG